jgi:Mg2+ and Co2+ transporter CorA
MPKNMPHAAIAANISAMRELLGAVADRLDDAKDAIDHDEQNQVIGALMDLDHTLNDIMALQRAAVALHRYRRKA